MSKILAILAGLLASGTLASATFAATPHFIGAAAARGDRVAAERFADRIWASAVREQPFYGERPPIYWTHGTWATATVWKGDEVLPVGARGVQMNDAYARLLVGRGSAFDVNWARMTLVHEWAHDFQSAAVLSGEIWLLEGGAQAFSELVAPRIYARRGIRVREFASNYDRFEQRVKRERGRVWILTGQFNETKEP
jgi:hypothetical protein